MLARFKRGDGVGGVQTVGRADADGVHLFFVLEHLHVVAVTALHAVFFLAALEVVADDIRGRDDLHAGHLLEILHVRPRDSAGADKPNSKRFDIAHEWLLKRL